MDIFFEDYLERVSELHREFKRAFVDLPQEALDMVPGQDMNSLCVLVVHTTGSARFWVGDVAMRESSNRDRSAEFRAHGLSEAELVARLDAVETYIRDAVRRISLSDLVQVREAPGRTQRITVGWSLLHALEHTGLHLGHAQITRQLWEQRRDAAGA
jgi:hypothetical protein